MFDWFRDMGLELNGIDSVSARKERIEKRERKKQNRFILSGGMKALIVVCGVVYIVMAGSMISALKDVENSMPHIIKYSVMSVIAIVTLFAVLFGKKKGEIIALVGIFVFLTGLFLSIALV